MNIHSEDSIKANNYHPAENIHNSFYYATIAYHVGLNAVLGWPQGIMVNVLEKKDIYCWP